MSEEKIWSALKWWRVDVYATDLLLFRVKNGGEYFGSNTITKLNIHGFFWVKYFGSNTITIS